MTRERFLFLCALALPACFGVGCVSPAASGTGSWPGQVSFTTVRGFTYACEADRDPTFVRANGELHPGNLTPGGVRLSAEQVRRLMTALNTPTPMKGRTACYVPHHAFVLYDAADRPVASVDVCFTCHHSKSRTRGLPSHFDYGALWQLVHELGLPADTTPGYYRRLWEEKVRLAGARA